MGNDLIQRGCAAIARGLREFGYPSVTAAQIEDYHQRWLKGEKFSGDVIALFAERDFESRADIFGTPEAPNAG